MVKKVVINGQSVDGKIFLGVTGDLLDVVSESTIDEKSTVRRPPSRRLVTRTSSSSRNGWDLQLLLPHNKMLLLPYNRMLLLLQFLHHHNQCLDLLCQGGRQVLLAPSMVVETSFT